MRKGMLMLGSVALIISIMTIVLWGGEEEGVYQAQTDEVTFVVDGDDWAVGYAVYSRDDYWPVPHAYETGSGRRTWSFDGVQHVKVRAYGEGTKVELYEGDRLYAAKSTTPREGIMFTHDYMSDVIYWWYRVTHSDQTFSGDGEFDFTHE